MPSSLPVTAPDLAARAPRDEFLVFGSPTLTEAEMGEVMSAMRSGWVGTGPRVHEFERMLTTYVGAPEVRCLASCTAALILGMKVLGVGPDDEVLVPSMTFVASANAIEHTGATPVFVDSKPDTGLIDLDAAEAAITPRTKAIMPVHLAGWPVDLDRLARLRERGLLIIEDAAHALGAAWRGVGVGAHGNLAAFSFYVTKNITTIEGGAIATTDTAVAEEIERLALHGLSLGAWQRYADRGFRHYEVEQPGFKYNMTDVQAAIGLHQLPRLDAWIARRAELWERYDDLLRDLPLELPPEPPAHVHHARHLYQVRVGANAGVSRDEILDGLAKRNIGAGVHYRGVHLHPYYAGRYELRPADLPVANRISDTTLSLPLSPKVTEADQDDVVWAMHDILAAGRPTAAPLLRALAGS